MSPTAHEPRRDDHVANREAHAPDRDAPPVRVILWGLGAMGRLMARMVLADPTLQLVGGVSKRAALKPAPDLSDLAGLNRPTGVPASPSLGEALERAGGANLVLHATGSFVDEVDGEIEACLDNDLDVITIAEEMAYPWVAAPDRANRIDSLARSRGRTVLGTGVNPGFVLDTLIIALTAATGSVESVYARRVNDLSPYGRTVMRTQGVGLSPDDFRARVEDGTVVGHVGFPESMHLIAKALGVRLDNVEQNRVPIISKVRRETPHVVVEPGMVAGCRHSARGFVDGRLFIELEHPQQIHPEAEGTDTGDFISITGFPSFDIRTGPEIPGGKATAAMAVNMILPVSAAGGGLLTMVDLPLPRGSARRDPEVVANG